MDGSSFTKVDALALGELSRICQFVDCLIRYFELATFCLIMLSNIRYEINTKVTNHPIHQCELLENKIIDFNSVITVSARCPSAKRKFIENNGENEIELNHKFNDEEN